VRGGQERNFATREDFHFPIVNFPFTCSNIPAAPAYGVYIYISYIPELVVPIRISLIEVQIAGISVSVVSFISSSIG
jgi:hypothetical protein